MKKLLERKQSQQGCLDKWKGQFHNLLGKSSVGTNHKIQTIIHCQCEIELINFYSRWTYNGSLQNEESLSYQ